MASFTPSPAELALVTQIFLKADPQKLGILTGDAALKVFGGARLLPTVLGEIWNIADEDNNGWLPKKGVAIAVRLMGWAQKGEKVTQALVNKPGPLPTLEGIQVPIKQQTTGISLPKSPPPGLPILTPQDKAKFMGIFQNCQPTNGLLTGEKARDLFVKSKLPVEKLGQIWNLADTQDRGALDATDFIIGMYLIQASMSGQLSFIPTSLPPGLYEQASGSGGVVSHITGGGVPISPVSPGYLHRSIKGVQQQHTGPSALQAQTTGPKKAPVLPVRKPTAPMGSSPFATTQQAWDVTPTEKATADRFFDTLDSQKLGYIEGAVAVPFMLQSNLPEEVLAQVWDLADISNDGRLTRDGFAVAMHLIQGKLSGKEVPASLPQSLIPPSMRTNGASPFSVPAPQPQEPQRDLIWDDTPPPSASPPPGQTQSSMFIPPPISPPKPQVAVQDPFGSGTFGMSSSTRNFLDDDEPAASSPPLQDQSAEIGNVQIQLSSTNQSLNNAKAEREPIEQTLATQAAQLSALQTQLSSAKAAYETETKLLNTLRDRMGVQTAEIQKAREELIRAESDLSAVRVEKAEIEGAFLRDKEDVRELHRKMAETGTEIAGLKLEIEKAKKEAKQQKGLLAIARKQLSTKETEKIRVAKDLEEALEEVKEATTERESVEAELNKENDTSTLQNGHGIVHSPVAKSPEVDSIAMAIAQPLPTSLPVSPDPATPSASSMKSNNPFDRLTRSGSSASNRSRSPFPSFPDRTLVKTPTPGPVDAAVDPFGLSQAFTAEPTPEVTPEPVTAEAGVTTPRSDPVKLSISNIPQEENPVSPASASGSDFFSTPPTTAAGLSQSPALSNRLSEVPSVDSQFPPIDGIPGSFPVSEVPHDAETDLGAPIKEIEVEESDSDEEPLSDVQHKLKTSAENTSNKESVANGVPSTSFDDAFGDSTSTSESTNLQTPKPSSPAPADSLSSSFTVPTDSLGSSITSEPPLTDAFGAPLTKTSDPFPVEPEHKVAGVNAFDEAMGMIPSNGVTPSATNLSFDTAFEDNFDFTSASNATTAFPPPTVTNGSNKSPSFPSLDDGFDNAFGVPANNGIPPLAPVDASKPLSLFDTLSAGGSAPTIVGQPPALPPRKSSLGPSAAITFDDAFGGVDSSQALKLDNAFDSISSTASGTTSSVSRPFPVVQSPPLSPKGGPSSPRISSVRTATPPPRGMSPPPRSSTSSSSKDGHDKPNPPRHSRLSIRLPFGKKKSKQDAAAPPVPFSHQQFLSPVEEPTGVPTPPVDDDVDSVKQLCGMGFSRTQAVTALERHGYDMQKALNSLLGSQ